MSRIGKIPVNIPKGVKVVLEDARLRVEGPKGKLFLMLPSGITTEQKEDNVIVHRKFDTKQNRSNHGTIRAHLLQMIIGVTQGHKKNLEVQGIGFRVQAQGQKLLANLGLSHPIEFPVPDGIKVSTPSQTEITVEGLDKALVGQVAANLRKLKPCEPYKGKGIRYLGEVIRRKQGKSVTK